MRAALVALAASALATLAIPAAAQSLRFVENRPSDYDFVDIPALPPEFGQGEFAFEIWVKPDTSFPVGSVWRASYDQLKNWSDADPEPYSSDGWWLQGNWLLDGHTRPLGYGARDTREGTFSLQFYGGGRLRWMFADTAEAMPKGMVYAVQAWPAKSTPSLLDGKWHHIVAVRRWREPQGATLELWIDGKLIATTDLPGRTNMRVFWDKLAHPEDPVELGGWSLGAEVMTAWNYAFTQYEDYKGWVDDIRLWGRAPAPHEIADWAMGKPVCDSTRLLSSFPFEEGKGDTVRDAIDGKHTLKLHRRRPNTWSDEGRTVTRAEPPGRSCDPDSKRAKVASPREVTRPSVTNRAKSSASASETPLR